jgi:anti-sigma regulatory factor (Ser/Thr protein kinase)
VSAPVTVELSLSGAAASVPAARRFVRSTLQSWELDQLVEAAVLVVSELATNAVLHARSSFLVRLTVDHRGALRVEVVDASTKRPQRRPFTPGSTTGRGLSIVEDLVSDWGVEPVEGGKVVWVEIVGDRSRREDAASAASSGRPSRGLRRKAGPAGPVARAA